MSSAPPQLIADRYRLVEPLGQGGMGRVWKARDEVLHRDVAIKELVPPPGLTEDERREMRERSLREARAIARLNHANVVRVFDVLRTDGDPWIVMEYIPSRSLQDVLASDGPVSPARATDIGLGVLGALKAAHRAGVMHRDVKPGNVLLGDDGRVVLTDFGLATVPGDPNVTRTGLVLGSPAYIAPERAKDGTFGPEADLWSLGATLYAALEGQSPFARPSAIATLAALATEPPPVSRRAGSLKTVLAGLLQKDPALRIDADTAERLLRRAARRGRPGVSLLDGVRRPGPNGAREPRVPRTPIVPVVPAPRPAEEEPAAAATPPPDVSPPSVPVIPADAETAKFSVDDSNAGEPTSVDSTPDAEETRPPAEPTVVVPAGGVTGKTADPAPTELVTTPAPSSGRAPIPTGAPVAYDEKPAGRGPLAALGGENRKVWLVGALVVLVLLAIAVIVPLVRGGSGGGKGDGTGPVTNPTSQAANPPAPTGSAAQPPAPTSGPPAQPSTTPSDQPGGNGQQLPAGWRLHKDSTGFSVPVPEGWTMRREKYGRAADQVRVYFDDPKGARMLLIDQTNSPLADAEADWRRQEQARKGNYRNYKRVTIRSVDYWLRAADWEWLFDDDGVRLHVRNRGFVTAKDKGYAIRWDVPADDWDENLKNFDIIADGFKPVRAD
ncbi:protein kinase [Plantactinospora sp. B5E13]|uniref:serine/threonine-protein kinase n=1 Tax=Plantactinospora sp. B5E13 TaxID=3153758 RepID=UPI00325EBCC5